MPGFAVTALTLAHFRSHRALRLVFDGRPVALWGPNGAGKTNVLEALSLLSPGRGLRRAPPEDLARRPGTLGWKVTAAVRTPGPAREIETAAPPGQPRAVRIDAKAATQAALGHALRVLWLVPAMDRLWLEGAEGRRRFLDRAALSLMPDHGAAVLAYDRALRERNRMLREGVTDARWYRAVEAPMAAAAATIAANRSATIARLTAAQAGGGGAFPQAALALVNEGGEWPGEEGDLAAALEAGRRRDMAAGRSLAGPHRDDLAAFWQGSGIAAAQCSTGEQKALLIALVLANARAIAADLGAAPVLLLDEVAAHLDPARRAALYDEIAALGAQAFLTGTERGLFDTLGDRGQSFAVAGDGGESRIDPA